VLLCKLAAKVCAGVTEFREAHEGGPAVKAAPKAIASKHNALCRENITKFVVWCTAFGVPREEILFESEDLVSLTARKHKVLVLMLDVARLAHRIPLPPAVLAERAEAVALQKRREDAKTQRAVRRIQEYWRAHQQRKRDAERAAVRAAEALHLSNLTRAATIAQAWWRGHVARLQHTQRCAATLVIQNAIRASLARHKFTKQRAAVQMMQSVIRMYLAKQQLQQMREAARVAAEREAAQRLTACLVLQAAWRGRTARLQYAADRLRVVAIQSMVRGHLARQQAAARHAAVVQLQSVCRMYLAIQARKALAAAAEQARLDAEQLKSAKLIQAVVRMYLVRKELPRLREEAAARKAAAQQVRLEAERAAAAAEAEMARLAAEAEEQRLAVEQEATDRAAKAVLNKVLAEEAKAEARRLESLARTKLENQAVREDPHTFTLKVKLRKVGRKELPKVLGNEDERSHVDGKQDAPAPTPTPTPTPPVAPSPAPTPASADSPQANILSLAGVDGAESSTDPT
jgi:hypothetical protein